MQEPVPFEDSDKKESLDFLKADRDYENLSERWREFELERNSKQFGICWNCSSFRYTRTKYGKEDAVCARFDHPDRLLCPSDPVVKCSTHSDRFALSLSAMWAMATLIEPKKPKQAGFVTEEEANGLEEDKAL